MIGRAGVGVDNVDVDAATRRGHRRRERARVDGHLGGGAHGRPAARALAQHPAGARGARAGALGALALRRHRARRQDARRARLRADRPAGRAPRARARDARRRATTRSSRRSASASSASSARRRRTSSTPRRTSSRCTFRSRTRRASRSAPTAFAKMRDGVRIVNAARGELVDEDALVEALESGKVAAAALDVFSAEPYSGPLLALDNVVATPHLAASTEEAQDRAGVIVAEQIVAALEGGLVTNAVNIPTLARRGHRGACAVRPARRQARPPRDGARARPRRTDRAHLLRRALAVRHAPAHGRRAERRLPGPHRPAGQLRQRAARRRRARDRGRRGAQALVTRLHEPRPRRRRRRSASRARRSAASTGTGS